LSLGPAHPGLEARIVEQPHHEAVALGEVVLAAGIAEDRVRLRVEVVPEAQYLGRLLHQAALEGALAAVGGDEDGGEVDVAAARPAAPEKAEAGAVCPLGQQLLELPRVADAVTVE